ncbi:MAG: AAA family ATPase [Candidatus Pacebacteria bacterium]|jgi:guanylate kinase|nr:AAA family ATPase [Candidatus Paceibacterota bacterium]MBP9780339.1 AAA family ATPase [Candidatus Paceibacterota bacterium]
MNKTFICLITGPSGSGKSSTSKALANKFERSAVIEVDTLRHMIKGGYVRPWPYNEEVELQLSLSVKNACDMANNFLEKGFNVFIDDVVGKKILEQYSNFFNDKNFKVFILIPSVDALLKRFDDRGEDKELRERTIELHKMFLEKQDQLNGQIINSSDQTLEETVDEVYKSIVSL